MEDQHRRPVVSSRSWLLPLLMIVGSALVGCESSEIGSVSTGPGSGELSKKRFDETPPEKPGRPAPRR